MVNLSPAYLAAPVDDIPGRRGRTGQGRPPRLRQLREPALRAMHRSGLHHHLRPRYGAPGHWAALAGTCGTLEEASARHQHAAVAFSNESVLPCLPSPALKCAPSLPRVAMAEIADRRWLRTRSVRYRRCLFGSQVTTAADVQRQSSRCDIDDTRPHSC
eukprot:scaffold13728_cov69-Phaeocystis_antarctica.AAC.3